MSITLGHGPRSECRADAVSACVNSGIAVFCFFEVLILLTRVVELFFVFSVFSVGRHSQCVSSIFCSPLLFSLVSSVFAKIMLHS